MMAIINGKRYNTEAAELCGIVDNDLYDERGLNEMLYQKRTGEFFLVRSDNTTSFEGAIIPLTFEEAYNWGNENLPDSEFEQYFCPEKLDKTTFKPLSIRMTEQGYGLVRRQAAKENRSMPEVLNDIIIKALSETEKREEKLR